MRHLLFFAACCYGHGAAFAQEKESPAELIRQLGSTKFSERESAMKALQRLGETALPALEDALRHPQLEVRYRAKQLVEKLHDRLFRDRLLPATKAAWDFCDEPALDALRSGARRLGLAVLSADVDEKLKSRTLTLQTAELPFWQAWAELCRAAGVTERFHVPLYRPASPAGKVRPFAIERDGRAALLVRSEEPPDLIMAHAPKTLPWASDVAGPVRVRGLVVPSASPGETCLVLEVRPHPGVPWLSLDEVSVHRIVDERGNALSLPDEFQLSHSAAMKHARTLWDRLAELPRRDMTAPPCDRVPLKLPPPSGDAKGYREVSGVISARFLHTHYMLEIGAGLLQPDKTFTGERGLKLKVIAARVEDGDLFLRMQAHHLGSLVDDYPLSPIRRIRPGVTAFMGPGDILAECVTLLDAKGNALPRLFTRHDKIDGDAGIELELRFQTRDARLDDLRLAVQRRQGVLLEVPFVLRELTGELPKRPGGP